MKTNSIKFQHLKLFLCTFFSDFSHIPRRRPHTTLRNIEADSHTLQGSNWITELLDITLEPPRPMEECLYIFHRVVFNGQNMAQNSIDTNSQTLIHSLIQQKTKEQTLLRGILGCKRYSYNTKWWVRLISNSWQKFKKLWDW